MSHSETLTLQTKQSLIAESNRLRLFSGSANIPLSLEVARYLGMDLEPIIRKRFADREIYSSRSKG